MADKDMYMEIHKPFGGHQMTSSTLIFDFKYGLFATFKEWCELLGEKTVLAKIARLDFCVASEELIAAAKASLYLLIIPRRKSAAFAISPAGSAPTSRSIVR